jgi:hypothetical protein
VTAAFPVPRPVELEAEAAPGWGPSEGSDGDELSAVDEVRGPETLRGRVEFGGPLIAPVDSSYHPEDAELQALLKARAQTFRFVLATMSVNFPFGSLGDPPLATASVEIELIDDRATGQTLAYSLYPASVILAREVTRGFTLQPDLTVAGTGGAHGGAGHHRPDPACHGHPGAGRPYRVTQRQPARFHRGTVFLLQAADTAPRRGRCQSVRDHVLAGR